MEFEDYYLQCFDKCIFRGITYCGKCRAKSLTIRTCKALGYRFDEHTVTSVVIHDPSLITLPTCDWCEARKLAKDVDIDHNWYQSLLVKSNQSKN